MFAFHDRGHVIVAHTRPEPGVVRLRSKMAEIVAVLLHAGACNAARYGIPELHCPSILGVDRGLSLAEAQRLSEEIQRARLESEAWRAEQEELRPVYVRIAE